MSVTILDRPQKDILDSNDDVILNSLYNASGGELPTNYDLGNDLSPLNVADSEISVLNDFNISGRLQLEFTNGNYTTISLDDRFAVDGWITTTNSNGGVFIGQIVSLDAANFKIQTTIPYDGVFATGTNTFNWYAKSYEVLVNIYVGLNPTHPEYAQQPSTLIAQKSITAFVFDTGQATNISNTSATGLIKGVINAHFEDIKSTSINLDQYTQFRIEYAEIYKRINPATSANELFDGTNYQTDWILGQPEFTEDSFLNVCPSASLSNEEFTTDLTDWTNTAFGGSIDWLYNAGSAEAVLPSYDKSQELFQGFAYIANANYNIIASIEGIDTFRFEVILRIPATTLNTVYRTTIDGTPTVIDFNFLASQFGNDYPDQIGFRAYNLTNSNNTVKVNYFRQTQADEGCLPFLSSIYAVRQFGSTYGGSMGDFEGNLDLAGKFLTYYKTKILSLDDIYPEISLIGNSNVTNNRSISVKATVTYSDASVIEYYSDNSAQGEGVYRVTLSPIITSIQNALLADSSLLVTNIQLKGVSNVTGLLSDWDKGTFETGGLPFDTVNPDSIGMVFGETDSTDSPKTGTRSGAISAKFDFTDVSDFNIWIRFAHGEKFTALVNANRVPNWFDGQADNSDIFGGGSGTVDKNEPLLYDSDIDSITCNGNYNAYYGCLSPSLYGSYQLTGTMFSNGSDNDAIGYVICQTTITGVEYTLSLIATTGGALLDVNPAYAGDPSINSILVGTYNVHLALVYNYGKADCTQIATIETGEAELGWNEVGDLDFKVVREGDNITCTLVNLVVRGNTYTGSIEYDLNTNVYTEKFKQKNAIGFAFMSQDDGGFKNVVFNVLGGGITTTNSIQLAGGLTYVLTGYVLFEQTGDFAYITDPDNESFVRVGFFTTGGVLITANVQYDKVTGNVTEYRKVSATINPETDTDVLIGVYKGGLNEAVGAQKVYVDDITVEGPEIDITETLPATYKKTGCNNINLKWLNDLGGWDNYTFEGKKITEIEISENKRYDFPVFGNWDAPFTTGTGTSFEQKIKYNKIQTLSTLIIDKDLKETLSGIKTSIHVLAYDDDLGKYITVLVDKDSFLLSQDGVSSYRFNFDIIKPDNYVQNA